MGDTRATDSMTAPQLFAFHRGYDIHTGNCHCFYCGGECNDTLVAQSHVKKTFTALDTVSGGGYICDGCVAAMDEKADIQLIDGTTRTKQKVRCYSWIIGNGTALAATKSHMAKLREVCLHPPSPPYVICLSESGQRQLMYRCDVGRDATLAVANLEGNPIAYRVRELSARLDMCRHICRVLGKPALQHPLTTGSQMKIVEVYGEETLSSWFQYRQEPLTELAISLTPSKKDCDHDHD